MKKLLLLLALLALPFSVRASVEYTTGIQALLVSSSAPDLLTNWTWAAWVYPASAGSGTRAFVARWTDGGNGRMIRISTDADQRVVVALPYIDWGPVYTATGIAPEDTWTHVVATRSGDDWTIYINGVYSASATNVGVQEAGGAVFLLCNDPTAFSTFLGKVAELAGWDAVLTAGEISALAHGTPPNRIRATKIQYYWPLHTAGCVGPCASNPHVWPDLGGGGWNATATGQNDSISGHAPMSPPGGAD